MAGKNILVVATHPDDETLGAGGTLLKHRENGDAVHWLIMTAATDDDGYSVEFQTKRRDEIKAVSRAYGFASTTELGLRTTRLDTYPMAELVRRISAVVEKVKPDTVYIPNRSDVHSDHQTTHSALIACTKSFRYPFLKKVLMYETPSETEFASPLVENAFLPNVYSDISKFMDAKLSTMTIYASECGDHPFPRSPETLKAVAMLRGSVAHVKYAEAFMLLKEFC